MEDAANENERLTFQALAAPTAKVLAKIEQTERKADDAQGQKAAGSQQNGRDDRDGEHERYVIQRLSDLAAFERRAMGFKR